MILRTQLKNSVDVDQTNLIWLISVKSVGKCYLRENLLFTSEVFCAFKLLSKWLGRLKTSQKLLQHKFQKHFCNLF